MIGQSGQQGGGSIEDGECGGRMRRVRRTDEKHEGNRERKMGGEVQ